MVSMNDRARHHPIAPELGNSPLITIIRDEIARQGGKISFARFMELALYHPVHGYYLSPERRPGRPGDFITAPEATPYFGLTLARQIAECWERLGEPARFEVREYGGGVGGLAYDVIAGLSEVAPGAFSALIYRLIELNPHRRAEAAAAMAEVGLADKVVVEAPDAKRPPLVGVLLANEVADAFPVHRLLVGPDGVRERYVAWSDGRFVETEGALTDAALRALQALLAEGVELPPGSVIDVSPAAADWFATAAQELERGYAIVIDYGYPARELYQAHRLAGTVRAYHAHTVNDDPLIRAGEQDLTAHVDFTALQRAGETAGLQLAGLTTQGAFLASLGLGDFLLRLQQDPETTLPDYLRAQAAVLRLIDPGGLGRFRVLLMAKDAPIDPPLRGLREHPPAF
jgi:SAM-dependent MidA family methyltransferase